MPHVLAEDVSALQSAVLREAEGLRTLPKTLAPWLFYDEAGCDLFQRITRVPEYYLTRTERTLFEAHQDEIAAAASGGKPLTIVELGAGTAEKTGVLLKAVLRRQRRLLYQPIDVAESALDEASTALRANLPDLTVLPQIANYTVELMQLQRAPDERVMAMYIGSSIGNFTPPEAAEILRRLRGRLHVGDMLLLGTDRAPGPAKSVATLLSAYDDVGGVTAEFNRNVLTRLNRDLGTDFDIACFAHEARWNAVESRIEMHLRSLRPQRVQVPSVGLICFAADETIHTENSYKFTDETIEGLLRRGGFAEQHRFNDASGLYTVTLSQAV